MSAGVAGGPGAAGEAAGPAAPVAEHGLPLLPQIPGPGSRRASARIPVDSYLLASCGLFCASASQGTARTGPQTPGQCRPSFDFLEHRDQGPVPQVILSQSGRQRPDGRDFLWARALRARTHPDGEVRAPPRAVCRRACARPRVVRRCGRVLKWV